MQGIRSIQFGWAGVLILFAVWTVSSLWLLRLVPVSEWIPIAVSGVGLLIALAVSVWNVSEQRRLSQMNFAVTLWGQWAEESMLAARNTAWDAIAGLPVVDGRKRVGELRTSGPENEAKYRSIARVNHFFADLNDFLDAGLLNHRDVDGLFRDTLQAYYCHLMIVDIARGVENLGGDEQQLWFDSKVLGLADHLKLRTPKHYTRYGRTLAGNLEAAAEQVKEM